MSDRAVFSNAARPEVRDRNRSLHGLEGLETVRHYQRGQEICGQDHQVRYWYRLVTGVARKYALRADGRRQIIDLLLPGDCFGFTARERHSFSVEAVTDDTIVACYPRQRVEDLADSDPRISREIRQMAFEAISRLQEQILTLGRATARQRVSAFLLCLADRSPLGTPDRLELKISRYDMADYLGLSSETVSRSLTGLKYCGAIRFAGTRRLKILDRAALDQDDSGPAGL